MKNKKETIELEDLYKSSVLYALHIMLIIAAISLTAIMLTYSPAIGFVLLILDGIANFVLFKFIKMIFNEISKTLAYLATVAAVLLYLFAGLFLACSVKF